MIRNLTAPRSAIRFAGYAGLFDIPDADQDTLRRGAFLRSIAQRSDPFPLLWQHRPDQRIGEIESLSEDARGLRVIARVDRTHSRAAQMLLTNQVSGLSFGYRATNARHTPSGRELLGVDLFEISLVTHPLQHASRVHFVT